MKLPALLIAVDNPDGFLYILAGPVLDPKKKLSATSAYFFIWATLSVMLPDVIP